MGAVMTCSLGFGFAAARLGGGAAGRGGGGIAAGAAAWRQAAPWCGSRCSAAAPVGMRLMRTASSPSLISISAMPDSSSSSISFLILRMSMPGNAP